MLPKIWKGGTVFILGGGPSFSKINLDLIKNKNIIAVNNSYGYPVFGRGKKSGDGWLENTERYIPYEWVDIVWFGDGVWFDRHRIFLKDFKGIIAHCAPRIGSKKISGLVYYKRSFEKAFGIEKNDEERVVWNKNSGSSAINLAYHLGATTIVLLGFDMKRTIEKTNWHKDHPNPPEKNPYYRYLRSFPIIRKDLKGTGVEIINCTEDSAIQDFKKMKLEDFLSGKERNRGRNKKGNQT